MSGYTRLSIQPSTRSLQSGKIHLIILPLQKTDRPISLLSSTSKVLEHLVDNRSTGSHPFNLCFCEVFISTTAPVSLTTFTKPSVQTSSIMLSSSQCDVIYPDFAKAFDRVSHNELLFKLLSVFVCQLWHWCDTCQAGNHVSVWFLPFHFSASGLGTHTF